MCLGYLLAFACTFQHQVVVDAVGGFKLEGVGQRQTLDLTLVRIRLVRLIRQQVEAEAGETHAGTDGAALQPVPHGLLTNCWMY